MPPIRLEQYPGHALPALGSEHPAPADQAEGSLPGGDLGRIAIPSDREGTHRCSFGSPPSRPPSSLSSLSHLSTAWRSPCCCRSDLLAAGVWQPISRLALFGIRGAERQECWPSGKRAGV